MDFSFTEDQNAIRDLAHQIFTDQVTDEWLLKYDREDHVYAEGLWSLIAEQGLLGIAIPESCGGSGLGFFTLCLVLQEQGRRVAPLPLLSNLVLAGLPVAQFGSDEQQQQLLAPLASGAHQITAAIAELGMLATTAKSVSAKDGVLNGTLEAVPYGAQAAFILVPATDSDGNTSVYIVDTKADGVSLASQPSAVGEVQAQLTLSAVTGELLGKAGQGEEIITWIEQRANVAIGAIQAGITEEALKRTAEYSTERKQFGVPIGSFQAYAMRAADAFMEIEALRSIYWEAAWLLDEGREAESESLATKFWACRAGHKVTYATQHLHGGMGADVEFPIHRYFLAAKQLEFMLGAGGTTLAKLGAHFAQVDDSGTSWMRV